MGERPELCGRLEEVAATLLDVQCCISHRQLANFNDLRRAMLTLLFGNASPGNRGRLHQLFFFSSAMPVVEAVESFGKAIIGETRASLGSAAGP